MNLVILVGIISSNIDFVTTQNGNSIAKFSLVWNEYNPKTKAGTGHFFNVKAFGKTAELIKNHFHKGKKIAIVGRLINEVWADDEYKKHSKTFIYVKEINFVEGGNNNG